MTESQINSFHLPVEIHHHWHFSFFQNNANRVILFASECDFYNYRQSHSVIFEFWLKDGTLSHCLEKENRWKNSKMKQKWTKHMFENWEYYSHINNWLVELDDNRYRLCDCQSLSFYFGNEWIIKIMRNNHLQLQMITLSKRCHIWQCSFQSTSWRISTGNQ